ncbi:Uncharacterised protein [uncultured archaeon]|nr:Uncharacterised protein [uncultured archaeon]
MHKNLDILKLLKETFGLLHKQPVLFLPKLLIAVLYGFITLYGVSLARDFFPLASDPANISISAAQGILVSAGILLISAVFVYFLDLFFSGLYPVLTEQAKRGKVSFRKAFLESKGTIRVLFTAGVIVTVLLMIVSFIESLFSSSFKLDAYSVVLYFVIAFMFIFLFYFLYPVIVFKKKSVLFSFKYSLSGAFSNKRSVFLFSIIPFFASIIKFWLAIFSNSVEMLVIFWILTILTGIIYSIHAVSNQLLYSKTSSA